MMVNLLLVLLLALALAGVVGLVWRKLPVLVITDPSRLKHVGQQQVKRRLVEARLKRKLAWLREQLRPAAATAKPAANGESSSRLAILERRLKDKLEEHTAPLLSIQELMNRAAAADDYAKAEASYLEVLKFDPHYLAAYQGLGELYLEHRDYEEAREVYEYLARRGSAAASRLGLARVASGQGRLEEAKAEYLTALETAPAVQPRLELARILRELGDLAGAVAQAAAAREFEPQNPKMLDFFIELSILNGQPNEAREALDVLRQVNPDNQKIAEFAAAIRELAAKQKPAAKRAGARRAD